MARMRFVFTLTTLLALAAPPRPAQSVAQNPPAASQERVRTEIPYRDGTVVLVSDFQERETKTRYRARGRVEVSFQDMLITCDEAEYDAETREGSTTGTTRFSQGKQWFTCSRAEFDFANHRGVFYETTGFTDQEFLIRGRTVRMLGRDRYSVDGGYMTSCQEKRPKWSFRLSSARIRVEGTARMRQVVFQIKDLPVLYFPYLIYPMEKKERSSGFLPFHMGNSTSKGRVFSQGYFQTLGQSADATIYGDYFSLRGLATGVILRARPNPKTRLYAQMYGIKDKLGQGGGHLIIDGQSSFGNGFRAVANVNITTNFRFRQAFADTFRSATVPLEQATAFLTKNQGSMSTNISLERQETFFPGRSLVVRKAPSFELWSLGRPLGRTPLIFHLRASADGVSRVDASIETPSLMQRFDLYPALSIRLPGFAGFSLVPTVGFRGTYYSARMTDGPEPKVVPEPLQRQYADFELDARIPTLERTFRGSRLGRFRHVIEPLVTYRWIGGVDNLRETVRFDAHDAVADTNEVEYGVVNRFYRSRRSQAGPDESFEFLSLGLYQKYYFDPAFGGAFRSGESNAFYPLYTLTGFAHTGTERHLAPASMVLRLRPIRAASYDVRADYDPKFQKLRDASVSAYWQQEKLFFAGTYVKTRALEPGTFESHHIQGQAGFGSLAKGASASVVLSYNIRTAKLLNSHTRLRYAWDCCGLSAEFQQYDLGLRVETRFSFSFSLKGLGSFGNLKRPESMF